MRFIRGRRPPRVATTAVTLLPALFCLFHPGRAPAQSVTVTVPGTGNLWLAGMPAGTFDGFPPLADSAPAQSPTER